MAFTSTTYSSPFSLQRRAKVVLSASLSSSVEKEEKKKQQSLRVHKDDNPADIGRRITHFGKIGRTDDALSLYFSLYDIRTNNYNPQNNNNNNRQNGRRKKTIGPTTRFMNCAIDACARARPPRLQQAQDIFHHGVHTHGLSPNVFTFGSLISACARARDANKALELLNTMQEQYSIRPNAVVYSTAISACERTLPHPHYKTALKLLHQAIQDPTVQMTVVGYNTAISALAKAGQWKMAVQLLDEMEQDNKDDTSTSGQSIDESKLLLPNTSNTLKPKPDQVTYGTVMAACERSFEWKEVLRFAKKMQSLPNIQMDGIALTSALHACQQLGYADEAIYYLNLMKQLSNNVTTESNAESTRGKQRKGAKKPLQGPDEVAYHLAISACARSNEENRYLEGIRLLEEEMPLWNLKPDVVAYTAAIAGCADAGDWKKAVELLTKMKVEDNVMPNVVTYSAVIGACATATAKAAKINEENDNNQDDSPYVWDYEDDDTSKGGEPDDNKNRYDYAVQKPLDKAMQLLSYMKTPECSVEPNIVTYNAAIRACAEGHDLLGAFRLMDELIERGLQPTIVTYGSLMTACERVGSVEAASDVFKRMRKTGGDDGEDADTDNEELKPNEIIYGAAISCCRKARQPDRAFLLLRRMLKDGLSPNAATFNTVILASTEGKKPNLDQAILVYRLMKSKKLLSSSSNTSPSLYSLVDEAATTPSTEPSATTPVFCKPNRQTYNILIQALSSNRRPEEAELFLRKMRLDGFVPDVDLFTSTVQAYEQNGQPMKALQLMENMREDGYDFYEVKVLNEAFKKAVKLVNVVGRGFSSPSRNMTTTTTATPTEPDAKNEGGKR